MIKLKELLSEAKIAKVPKFKTSKQMFDWMKSIPANAKVGDDVFDPETGEVHMEKGQSKAKLGKLYYKKHGNSRKSLDDIDFFYFDPHYSDKHDFEEYFNVVYRDNAKGMSDDEKEMLRSGDYDYDFSFPSKIKRKDGKPFNENDKENIENFIEWYQKNVLYGGNIHINVGIGKNVADGEPMYI